MTFIISLSISSFIVLLALFINNRTATKPNRNIILGSTLPYEHLEDERVLSVVNEYKKSNLIFMTLAVVSYLPIVFFNMGISLIYMFLWITAIIYFNGIVLKRYLNKIQELKRENDWFVKNKHIIKVDTEVTRLKDKMPISKLWFLPAVIINLIGVCIAISREEVLVNLIIIFSSCVCFILFFIIYNSYCRGATKVYSEDSEINMACNYVYRRVWSIIWVLAATISSATLIGSLLDITFSLPGAIITSVIMILAILIGDRKIKATQNKLIKISQSDIYYTDDDESWGVFIYSNPNDPSFFVEKRIGIGNTINMGNPTAKKLAIGFSIVMLIILLGTLGLIVYVSNSNFIVNIDENKITIDAPLYGTEFNLSDIEEVREVDNLPKGKRTNGTETEDLALGHYNLDNYGKSRVYVFSNQPKIILIKLKNQFNEQYIFLTANTAEETEKYFNMLRNIK